MPILVTSSKELHQISKIDDNIVGGFSRCLRVYAKRGRMAESAPLQ